MSGKNDNSKKKERKKQRKGDKYKSTSMILHQQ
jgi:hypothetical protein